MANPVIIEDYDPRWPQLFEMLRSRVFAVLNELAISIEHVGSTAVPGLAAKPIIDIDVLLRSSTDLPVVIRKLAELGYEHKGDWVSARVRPSGRTLQLFNITCMYAHRAVGNTTGISRFGTIFGHTQQARMPMLC